MPSYPTVMDPASRYVTLINTYAVDPGRAEALIEFLAAATHSTVKHIPGFISANLHVSADRTRVVNYAQWQSPEAIAAAQTNPDLLPLMQEQLRIAQSFTPIPYELRASIHAAGGD